MNVVPPEPVPKSRSDGSVWSPTIASNVPVGHVVTASTEDPAASSAESVEVNHGVPDSSCRIDVPEIDADGNDDHPPEGFPG